MNPRNLAIFPILWSLMRLLSGVTHAELATPNHDALLRITAGQANLRYPNAMQFSNGVVVYYGLASFYASALSLTARHDDAGIGDYFLDAPGTVGYRNAQFIIEGSSLSGFMKKKTFQLSHITYQLLDRQSHGQAEHAELCRDTLLLLKQGTFTSCCQQCNLWLLRGSKLDCNLNSKTLHVWHSRFYLFQVPLFYLPYCALPLGTQQRTGLLFPFLDANQVGLPFYWGIAPSLDVTITPQLDFLHKCAKWNIETRYRFPEFGLGSVVYSVAPGYHQRTGNSSGCLEWKHTAHWDNECRFEAQYIQWADHAAAELFAKKTIASTAFKRLQRYQLSQARPHYDATATIRQFQHFGDEPIRLYNAMPTLSLIAYHNQLFGTRAALTVPLTASQFQGKNLQPTQTTRLLCAPEICVPYAGSFYEGALNATLFSTYYRQVASDEGDHKKHIPRRFQALPILKGRGKLIVERYLQQGAGVQTIEPCFQYLYIPETPQAPPGCYDTDEEECHQPVSPAYETPYHGHDRITGRHEVTLGGTTRWVNKNFQEYLNLSIKRSIPLKRDVAYSINLPNCVHNGPRWLLDMRCCLNSTSTVRGTADYSVEAKQWIKGTILLEAWKGHRQFIQMSYRFSASHNAWEGRYSQKAILPLVRVHQVGAYSAFKLTDHTTIMGSYYHDVQCKKTAEYSLSCLYETCCGAFGLSYQRSLSRHKKGKAVRLNGGISLNYELRGLQSSGRFSTKTVVGEGILPYRQQFSR